MLSTVCFYLGCFSDSPEAVPPQNHLCHGAGVCTLPLGLSQRPVQALHMSAAQLRFFGVEQKANQEVRASLKWVEGWVEKADNCN